jgi:beta-glucosidase/6-phospho-beta-glucosidase/beta-galactosidase
VNVAGFHFGCVTDGSQNISKAYPPVKALGGPDGAAQMQHFVKNDNMNIFRLPVGWQYLVNNKLGRTLDSGNLAKYDQLVQACLATGSSCIIDVHNYARWNGQVIGQVSGPTNDQFVNLWTQLATKYKKTDRIPFGVMNEPHDVDINKCAATVQLVVTAIRGARATTQISKHHGASILIYKLIFSKFYCQEKTTLRLQLSSQMAAARHYLKLPTQMEAQLISSSTYTNTWIVIILEHTQHARRTMWRMLSNFWPLGLEQIKEWH